MTQMNRTVRAALVTVAALTGGAMTLASAQTTTSMPMKSMSGKSMMMPTKKQCMTAKYKNTAACKKMMMMKGTK